MIAKFQLQNVVQSFQIPCWLTCKKLGNLTKKGITMTSIYHESRMCPSLGGCAPAWEGVPQFRRVCPTEGGCATV